MNSIELTLIVDPDYEADWGEAFCFRRLELHGISGALSKLTVMVLNEDPCPLRPRIYTLHGLEVSGAELPRLVSLYADVCGIQGNV